MMGRLARETDEGKKIAVFLDNARFHHAKALNDLYAPGQALERITPIYMPPLRPRPWDPQNTYGTPPKPTSPTPARARPAKHPRGLHHLHHQPHLRLRLRASTTPQQKNLNKDERKGKVNICPDERGVTSHLAYKLPKLVTLSDCSRTEFCMPEHLEVT